MNSIKFHYALSFSGATRAIAERIANSLADVGYRVFYDRWFESEMLGADGASYLRTIYTKRCDFCVVLIDKEYDKRDWTNLEREIIQARAFSESSDILLPVMLTEYRPEWLTSTRIFFDYLKRGHDELIRLLTEKISLHTESKVYGQNDLNDLPIINKPPVEKVGLSIAKDVLIIDCGGSISLQRNEGNNSTYCDLMEVFPKIKDMELGIDVLPLFPNLNSVNIEPKHWKKIALTISDHYHEYHGFIILHGNDTMHYTASMLSFMLSNLNKPIVITGSMLPATSLRTDAWANLSASLSIAGAHKYNLPIIPEVLIIFGAKVLRGNRATHVSTDSFNSFESPNFPPIGLIGENIIINQNLIPSMSDRIFMTNVGIENRILQIDPYMGFHYSHIKHFKKEIRGAVLLLHTGEGINTNTRNIVDELVDEGIFIVAVTRAPQGTIHPSAFNRGAPDFRKGFAPGYDMTPVSAACKLMHGIAIYHDINDLQDYITKDICGELTKDPD